MAKKVRITTRNNSDARNFTLLRGLCRPSDVRHNGGKLVIAIIDDAALTDVVRLLEDSHAVASYEVVES